MGSHLETLLDITEILALFGFSLNSKNNQKAVILVLFPDVSFRYKLRVLRAFCWFKACDTNPWRPATRCMMQSVRPPKKVFNTPMSFPHQSKSPDKENPIFQQPSHQSSRLSVPVLFIFSFLFFCPPPFKGQPSRVTCCFSHD